MAATNAQQAVLADSPAFQEKVRSSILKKALSILENQGSYTAPQIARAKSITQGQDLSTYYKDIASSTNIIASTITFDFDNRYAVSDITEAALDSQVATVVFTDLA